MASVLRTARLSLAASRPLARGFSSTPAARDHFLNANAEQFRARALDAKSSKPVLVDFYADWCQPCRVLTPLLKGVTGPETNFDLLTLNVDEHPELAGEFKITALPTVIAFKDGKVKNKFIGFRAEAEVKKFLSML